MRFAVRTVVIALLAAQGLALAGPRHDGPPPRHWHHHHRGGGWSGLALGLAVALPLFVLADDASRAPEPVYLPGPPAPMPAVVQATPMPPPPPEPVVYPRDGQGRLQLESDQRGCNRWATTQPAAMADASLFQRAVQACMDARGYTLR